MTAAYADQQVQLVDTSIGFSSPGDAYGPWQIADFRYIDTLPDQSFTVDLSHRDDQDQIYPTSGNYGNLSYSRDLSARTYVNAAVGFGSGDPFPTQVYHLEFNYKASSDYRFVTGVAGDAVSYQNGLKSTDVGLALSYYWPHTTLQVREYAVSDSYSPTRGSTYMSLEVRPSAMSDIIATGIVGPQYYEVIIPGVPAAFANESGWVTTLSYQQWLNRNFGLIIGGYLSNYTEFGTGAPIAAGRGITFGVSMR
jgi:YaiO family outer membrane protein